MLDTSKEVQGIALYAEFRRSDAATQIILTPDGYDEEGREVASALYRRVITSYSPKKQWRNTPLGWTAIRDRGGRSLEVLEKDGFVTERMKFANHLFTTLASGGWEMVKQPVFIEVTKKDLSDVRNYKTPSKVVYRINQSRTALSFPDLPTK